jgi:hypothetical protein
VPTEEMFVLLRNVILRGTHMKSIFEVQLKWHSTRLHLDATPELAIQQIIQQQHSADNGQLGRFPVPHFMNGKPWAFSAWPRTALPRDLILSSRRRTMDPSITSPTSVISA